MKDKPILGLVMPSFNQAQYIEEAIESVLSHKSRIALRFAVIDGGSTDGTVEKIKKYARYIDFWVSESDNGQSGAINKGLRALDFDLWGYLNSDDYYLPGVLDEVVDCFESTRADWITGTGRYFRSTENISDMVPVLDWSIDEIILSLASKPIIVASQVSNFMSKRIIDRFGFFNEGLHYTMDVEFGLRPIVAGIRPVVLDRIIGMARLHDSSKTVKDGDWAFSWELEAVMRALDLSKNPRHEWARQRAVRGLSRRNALNACVGRSMPKAMRSVRPLFQHLRSYPRDLFSREVIGAIRRRVIL